MKFDLVLLAEGADAEIHIHRVIFTGRGERARLFIWVTPGKTSRRRRDRFRPTRGRRAAPSPCGPAPDPRRFPDSPQRGGAAGRSRRYRRDTSCLTRLLSISYQGIPV